jgi:hypothetical protein
MLNRAKAGIGVAAIGMAMALIPAISPASASMSSVSGVSSLSSSALCRDYKNQQSALANTQSSALARAYASGNWPAIQKALLSTYSSATVTNSKLESVLSGAPSNVKAAVGTFVQFQPDEFRHTDGRGLDESEVGVGGEGPRSLRREAVPRPGSQDNDTDHLTGDCGIRKVQVALQHLTAS